LLTRVRISAPVGEVRVVTARMKNEHRNNEGAMASGENESM